jgi:hypothetical protein
MPKTTNNAKQYKTIRLYPELIRELKAVAKENNMTQQEIIELGIKKVLIELKEKKHSK